MDLYTELRQFADSWGLLYMMLIFIVVLFFVFRPGSKSYYEHQARIPLDEETSPDDKK
ncbi:MAG: cbb3-type cytochrome C oxidase subunit 3 [Rhodomicrobium sp.]|nr:MAG: cbb3-type cytochrome C oxidase subunit 3 [Rhodomicrobium sp.]